MTTTAFATHQDYLAWRGSPDGLTESQIDAALLEASQRIRAEALAAGKDVDGMVTAGNLLADTPKHIACDMVAEALRRRAANKPAGSTTQMSTGPFAESVTMSPNLADDLFMTRTMRRQLRIGQQAGVIALYKATS